MLIALWVKTKPEQKECLYLVQQSVLELLFLTEYLKNECLFQAVCCNDPGDHCCPKDTVCDIPHLLCNDTSGTLQPMLKKHKAQPMDSNLERKTCPGGLVTCRNNETCCRLHTGAYGCCPLPKVSFAPCSLQTVLFSGWQS